MSLIICENSFNENEYLRMQKSLLPFNEAERLADLQRFKILDTLPEEDFNDLVELVAQICNCPIASITFIDKDRQWFKAKKTSRTVKVHVKMLFVPILLWKKKFCW